MLGIHTYPVQNLSVLIALIGENKLGGIMKAWILNNISKISKDSIYKQNKPKQYVSFLGLQNSGVELKDSK